MKLGLNLSFAVKRWMEPTVLAKMCKEDFEIDHVQFSWDFIDPWWPSEQRDQLAREFKKAFDDEGVKIDSSFAGNAAYTFAHFLAPSKIQRDLALEYFKRAADVAVVLGAPIIGSPAGGMSYDVARDPVKRKAAYDEMIKYYFKLAEYCSEIGIEEIQIEATPLWTEFPHSPEVSIQLIKDLEGTKVPVKLLVDWGHALFKPLLKDEADIELWFNKCAPYMGGIHLQQTDGLWDRHWDFTKDGIVTPELILKATHNAGLDDMYQYLEVITIYEDDDDEVYKRMKKTMDYLHKELKA